jgi:hypothetical protein
MKKEGYSSIASLWYSPATKRIVTEMDDEFHEEFSGLQPEQQKKILRLADLFSEWTKPVPKMDEKPPEPAGTAMEETISQVPVNPKPGATKPLPFVDTAPIVNVPPASFAPSHPIKDESDAEPFMPLDIEKGEEEPLKIKPKTIAGQISDIIDEMIQTSPLREKGIKLIERPDHGVDVWFGMEKFDGIESIPYPEVKQLIKAAAARWERESSKKDKPEVNP